MRAIKRICSTKQRIFLIQSFFFILQSLLLFWGKIVSPTKRFMMNQHCLIDLHRKISPLIQPKAKLHIIVCYGKRCIKSANCIKHMFFYQHTGSSDRQHIIILRVMPIINTAYISPTIQLMCRSNPHIGDSHMLDSITVFF